MLILKGWQEDKTIELGLVNTRVVTIIREPRGKPDL